MSDTANAATAPAPPRVAVVGCGYWGVNLVRNFSQLRALTAIVDQDPALAERLSATYNVGCRDFNAVLADRSVNAVAIAAPAALHYQLARAALEAGKHVFVEKPLALDVGEGSELCALAARQDLRLMVGHLLRYHPGFLELERLVRQGRLGRLQYVYSNRLSFGKIRREEDVLWSFAPHDLSMIVALVGGMPDRIDASAGAYLSGSIPDFAITHLSFPGGEQAHVFVSWLHPHKEQKLVAVGTEAMAVFDDTHAWPRKLLLYPQKVEWRDDAAAAIKADPVPIPLTEAEPLRAECQHFLHCVQTGATPRTDGEEALRVLRILDAATRSLRRSGPHVVQSGEPRMQQSFPGVQIHESSYVDEGVEIGEGSKIWHFSHILGGVKLGRNVSVGQNAVIGPRVVIGDNVKIQNNVSVYEGVTLEDGVFCGPSCVFTNVNNPRAEISRKSEFRATLVKQGATIGANATIVCGHTLGRYCFIAAGAVVTHDVADFALMAGVPARRVGWMSRAGARLAEDLTCPITAAQYRLVGNEQLVEMEGSKG
jgi:predicted dehydrogenase/acetyltransferase-like isoleucine patch superfamily enzyme